MIEDYDSSYIWKTKDGRIFNIRQMSNQHLINSAFKIARDLWRLEYFDNIQKELVNRKLYKEAKEMISIRNMVDAIS